MLSKCANPECSEKFLFLHAGKLFHLMRTPEVRAGAGNPSALQERFWLCERCAKSMTVVWNGKKAELKILPQTTVTLEDSESEAMAKTSFRSHAARAG
jgi:hypothetical protein